MKSPSIYSIPAAIFQQSEARPLTYMQSSESIVGPAWGLNSRLQFMKRVRERISMHLTENTEKRSEKYSLQQIGKHVLGCMQKTRVRQTTSTYLSQIPRCQSASRRCSMALSERPLVFNNFHHRLLCRHLCLQFRAYRKITTLLFIPVKARQVKRPAASRHKEVESGVGSEGTTCIAKLFYVPAP